MPDRSRLDTARDVLAVADSALSLADRVARVLGLFDPVKKAARLRARALRLDARAARSRPDAAARLTARAEGLRLKADALDASR